MSEIDWFQLFTQRKDIAERFGDIWDLPVAARYHQVLRNEGATGVRLLEVGAGDRSLKEKLAGYWGDFSYQSCDIDPSHRHDFDHIDKVSGEYDLICAFELIEHLPLDQAHHMAARMFSLTKPGGKVVMTTPNTYYPPAYLRDATHVTPFCFDELGGLLQMVGYRAVSIHRLYHASIFKKLFKRFLLYPVFRLVGIDFAKQIIVVAEKPQ